MSSSITTIDFLRHGQCIDGHCYRGSNDVALSDAGWDEMHRSLGQMSHDWQRIVSSPLIRCFDFAKVIAERQQLPLAVEAKFKELHFGEWEGQSIDKIWLTQQKQVEAWFANPILSPPPEGEAADSFSYRVTTGLNNLVDQYMGEHLLCISHGGVMRAVLAYCLSMPLLELHRFDVPYACISRIQVITDKKQRYYRLVFHNKFSN